MDAHSFNGSDQRDVSRGSDRGTQRLLQRQFFTGCCTLTRRAMAAGNGDLARYHARAAMRMARELGLYPAMAQLEAETRRAA